MVTGISTDHTCPDCGATFGSVLRDLGWFDRWFPAPHECAQRTARLAAEKEAEEQRLREWRENPPEKRVREVFRAAHLPKHSPAGMKQLIRAQVPVNAFNAVVEHRGIWLSGNTPARGLWLYGDTDLRKTKTLSALAFDVAHRTSKPVLFWNFADLMDNIRLAAAGKVNEYDPVAMREAKLFVLDDPGSIKTTETAWEEVYGIAEKAFSGWGGEQVLYLATNENPAAMAERLSPPSDPKGGERIVRRLLQITEQVEVKV